MCGVRQRNRTCTSEPGCPCKNPDIDKYQTESCGGYLCPTGFPCCNGFALVKGYDGYTYCGTSTVAPVCTGTWSAWYGANENYPNTTTCTVFRNDFFNYPIFLRLGQLRQLWFNSPISFLLPVWMSMPVSFIFLPVQNKAFQRISLAKCRLWEYRLLISETILLHSIQEVYIWLHVYMWLTTEAINIIYAVDSTETE